MRVQLLAGAFAVAAAALPLSSQAALFLGGGVGSARVNGGDFEGNDLGWKGFFGGGGKWLGAEAAYNDLGDHHHVHFNTYDAALDVFIPLGGSAVSLLGKGGVAFPDVSGKNADQESERRKGFWGAGVRAGLPNSPLGIRVEYERFRFSENVDLASVSLEFKF